MRLAQALEPGITRLRVGWRDGDERPAMSSPVGLDRLFAATISVGMMRGPALAFDDATVPR